MSDKTELFSMGPVQHSNVRLRPAMGARTWTQGEAVSCVLTQRAGPVQSEAAVEMRSL